MACCKQGADVDEYKLFNDNWQFVRLDSALSSADSSDFIVGKLSGNVEDVRLPHTSRTEPMVVNAQWQGICYYSKHFNVTSEQLQKNLFIKFEAAMNVADIYVNGQHVMNHMGGYLPFIVELNGKVKEGDNIIVVRLDNLDNKVTGPKPLKILDFNMYGGLYRDVKWIEESELYISDANIGRRDAGVKVDYRIMDGGFCKVNVKVDAVNTTESLVNARLQCVLKDNDGNCVASATTDFNVGAFSNITAEAAFELVDAKLWSPDAPNLYTLHTTLYNASQVCDVQKTRIGFRTIEVTAEGLKLNGKPTFLRGVNRHQEYAYVGYALSDEAQWRDAYDIKRAGFDYVRCSHYPQSPAFFDACDELGILCLDPILGWQYFGDSLFEKHAVESSRELIRRDYNHPSVLAWELSINETRMPESFISMVSTIRDEEQKGSLTAGWVKGGYDIYIEARQHRHGVDTTRSLLVSEYGDWEYYAQNAGFNQDGWGDLKEEERTSRQAREWGEKRMLQQAVNVQEAHNDNLSTHAFADGYWVMYDYNRGYANDLEYSGISDIFRLPKFAYQFYRSQRPAKGESRFNEPMVFIASHCTDSSATDVRVFSNCDEVKLFADGTEVTESYFLDAISQNLVNKPRVFAVGSHPQMMEAKGYIDGKEVCSHIVRRAGEVKSIKLTDNLADVAVDKSGDVVMYYANLVDENGTLVVDADNEVTFSLSGKAQFATPDGYSQTFTTKALGGIVSAVVVVSGEYAVSVK
jgi:beta-galactosidase